MTILAVFPGQGSQHVGMGAYLLEHEAGRATFAEADEVLGFGLGAMCLAGSLEELTRTDIAQPAVLAVSVAAWRVLLATGGLEAAGFEMQPIVVVGHSLGDYSALVATGALDFADALRVVRRRGQSMQECGRRNPGGMAAVLGLDDDTARAVSDAVPGVWAANFNSPGQVVVAGTFEGLEKAEAAFLAAGAKRVVGLKVSGAFHSPLMAEAGEAVRDALARVNVKPSAVAHFYSSTELGFPEPSGIKALLVRQVTSAVRFSEATENLLPDAKKAVEVGPGRVLSGLLKKIDPGLSVCRTDDEAALNEAAQMLRGR